MAEIKSPSVSEGELSSSSGDVSVEPSSDLQDMRSAELDPPPPSEPSESSGSSEGGDGGTDVSTVTEDPTATSEAEPTPLAEPEPLTDPGATTEGTNGTEDGTDVSTVTEDPTATSEAEPAPLAEPEPLTDPGATTEGTNGTEDGTDAGTVTEDPAPTEAEPAPLAEPEPLTDPGATTEGTNGTEDGTDAGTVTEDPTATSEAETVPPPNETEGDEEIPVQDTADQPAVTEDPTPTEPTVEEGTTDTDGKASDEQSTDGLKDPKDVTDGDGSTDAENDTEKHTRLPKSGGEWDGEPGNSKWVPDKDVKPKEKSSNPDKPYSNPENQSWKDIMDDYGIDGIPFKDGYPVFDEVAVGTVEIESFSDNRPRNFAQADEMLAEKWGMDPEDVALWRNVHHYTWHECPDCKTMQLVPAVVHANVPHDGGISVAKNG